MIQVHLPLTRYSDGQWLSAMHTVTGFVGHLSLQSNACREPGLLSAFHSRCSVPKVGSPIILAAWSGGTQRARTKASQRRPKQPATETHPEASAAPGEPASAAAEEAVAAPPVAPQVSFIHQQVSLDFFCNKTGCYVHLHSSMQRLQERSAALRKQLLVHMQENAGTIWRRRNHCMGALSAWLVSC